MVRQITLNWAGVKDLGEAQGEWALGGRALSAEARLEKTVNVDFLAIQAIQKNK